MAFCENKYCGDCEEATAHTNGRCDICRELIMKSEIAQWDNLTSDERYKEILSILVSYNYLCGRGANDRRPVCENNK